MNDQEYIQGALRTENKADGEYMESLKKRIQDPKVMSDLHTNIAVAIRHGDEIDKFKKLLFYGKEQDFYYCPFNPTTAGSRDRAYVCIRLLHAAIGFYTEATEIFEALYKHIFDGETLDYTNLMEEGGDLFWYMAIFVDELRTTFEDLKRRNNRKLRARYPDKFTEQNALVRDLERERQVLEATDEHPGIRMTPDGILISGVKASSISSFTFGSKFTDAIKTGNPPNKSNWVYQAETFGGSGVLIHNIDFVNGFINGYLDNNVNPQIWALNNGEILSGLGGSEYNLKMPTIKEIK